MKNAGVLAEPINSRMVGNPSFTGLGKSCPLYAWSFRQRFLLIVSRRTETVIDPVHQPGTNWLRRALLGLLYFGVAAYEHLFG